MRHGKQRFWSGVFLLAWLTFCLASCRVPNTGNEEARLLRAQLEQLRADIEHKKNLEELDRRETRLREDIANEQRRNTDALWDKLQKILAGFEAKLDNAVLTQAPAKSRLATAELRRELSDLRDLISDVADQLSAQSKQVSELLRRSKRMELKQEGLADEIEEKNKTLNKALQKRITQSIDKKNATLRADFDKSLQAHAEAIATDVTKKLAALTKDSRQALAKLDKDFVALQESKKNVATKLDAMEKALDLRRKDALSKDARDATHKAALEKQIQGNAVGLAAAIQKTEADYASKSREQDKLAERVQKLDDRIGDARKYEDITRKKLEERIDDLGNSFSAALENVSKSLQLLRDERSTLVNGGKVLPAGNAKKQPQSKVQKSKGDTTATPFPEEIAWDDPWVIGAAGALAIFLLYLLLRKGPVEIEGTAQAELDALELSNSGQPKTELEPPENPRAQHTPQQSSASSQAAPQPSKRVGRTRTTAAESDASRDPVPSCVSIRIPADEQHPAADDAVRSILAADARVLVEPAPRLEQRTDGSLSVRFYAVGGLPPQELEELDLDCRQAAAIGQR